MKIVHKNHIIRLLKHMGFWLGFFGLLFVFTGLEALNRNFLLVDLPITLFYSYTVAYLIIPFSLRHGWRILMLILIAVFSIGLSYIRLVNYDYLYYSIYAAELQADPHQIDFPVLLLNAKDFSFGMIIFLATKYTFNWLSAENREMKIELEQMEAEVRLLKTQVDPHFLFNTMNNLYSLSVSRNENTKLAIRKMWGLMDFMIRESNMKEIALEDEVKVISDYIELEKLRYGDRLDCRLEIKGNLSDYRIPPMILYPFVENSFKHGCAGDPDFPWIEVMVKELPDKIRFAIRNSYPLQAEGEGRNGASMGIANIKKRLEYSLAGRYDLKIDKKPEVFEVLLDIYY